MVFAHDTELALAAAAALVNTARTDPDELSTAAQLAEFARTWQWSGVRGDYSAELAAVRGLRPTLERFWAVDKDTAVDIVNRVLRESNALPQLVKHDQLDYHIHAVPTHAPLAERMAVEAAMAMIDVIRADEMSRLDVCADDDCDGIVLDLSRNRSRRFCSTACGNRAAVAAYRARRR